MVCLLEGLFVSRLLGSDYLSLNCISVTRFQSNSLDISINNPFAIWYIFHDYRFCRLFVFHLFPWSFHYPKVNLLSSFQANHRVFTAFKRTTALRILHFISLALDNWECTDRMDGLYMLHVRQFLDYSPFIYYKDFQRDLGRSLYLQKEKEHKHPIMTAEIFFPILSSFAFVS